MATRQTTTTRTKPRPAAANPEAVRVKTIADTIQAVREQNVDIQPRGVDELRCIADDLDVPFLVVWLAQARFMNDLVDPDLDDIVLGIDWLREHNVPLDLLRHPEPRDAKWRASVEEVKS